MYTEIQMLPEIQVSHLLYRKATKNANVTFNIHRNTSVTSNENRNTSVTSNVNSIATRNTIDTSIVQKSYQKCKCHI
jgi:hypothetical protein